MDIETFINDKTKRSWFIDIASSLLSKKGKDIEGYEIDVRNIGLSRLRAEVARGERKSEFYLYENRIIAGLLMICQRLKNEDNKDNKDNKDNSKNIMKEIITSIVFNSCKSHSIDYGVNLETKITIDIGYKTMIIYHFSHFESNSLKDEYLCARFTDEIFYDSKLIFAQDRSDKLDKIMDENVNLKNSVLYVMLSTLLPRDLVPIILSFKIFDWDKVFEPIDYSCLNTDYSHRNDDY